MVGWDSHPLTKRAFSRRAAEHSFNNSPEESPGGCQCGSAFVVDTALPPGLDIHIENCGDLKNPLDCFSKQFRH